MSDASELLAELRDIVEPPAPAGTPPYLLIGNIALALVVIGLFMLLRRRRASAWRRESLLQLRAARSAAPDKALFDMASLLRRVMRLHGDTETVDGLNGEAWLAYLDKAFACTWFCEGDACLW